jgi:hypothetical protein
MDNRSAALRDTEGMFVLLTALCEPLQSTSQVFKDATLFFSRSTPNLATVIPAMDHIDELLSTNSLDAKYEPSIRAALGIAKKTLNRYYDKTDSSEVYRIAMGECPFTNIYLSHLLHCSQQVLHPRHKLKYFERANWEPAWITTAEDIVRSEYNRTYAKREVRVPEVVVAPTAPKKESNIFDDLPALAAPRATELRDDLARYLSTDPELVKDVLVWWTERKGMFPCLSRMALDYLSIPGELATNLCRSPVDCALSHLC